MSGEFLGANGLGGAIGNTPLIRLPKLSAAIGREIFGKAEHLNPGGSVKDRAALGIIEDFEKRGLLGENGVVVEGTAGNTGIGLTLVGNARGYRTIIVMPDDQAPEKYELLRTFGADLRVVEAAPFTNDAQLLPRCAAHRRFDPGRRVGEPVREYRQPRYARTHDRSRDHRANGRPARRVRRGRRHRRDAGRHGPRAQSARPVDSRRALRPVRLGALQLRQTRQARSRRRLDRRRDRHQAPDRELQAARRSTTRCASTTAR